MTLRLWIAYLGAATFLACSSGEGDGGTGGNGGSGGSGGNDCNSTPCFAPNECVTACGETPISSGCCPCPAGTKNVLSCPDDGGAEASACTPDASTAGVTCGSETCDSCQICVTPCCGGPQPVDGQACKPAPPFCADKSTISCTRGGSPQDVCSHSASGCSGIVDATGLVCQCQ